MSSKSSITSDTSQRCYKFHNVFVERDFNHLETQSELDRRVNLVLNRLNIRPMNMNFEFNYERGVVLIGISLWFENEEDAILFRLSIEG